MASSGRSPTGRFAATALSQEVAAIAAAARGSARRMATASAETRARALGAIADSLRRRTGEIAAANRRDLEAGRAAGLSAAMLDRLRLDADRIEAMAAGALAVSDLPEVVGRIDSAITRPNGLRVERVRIPLGVVLMIYESRPNVTVDAAALCIKSGNAVILRGGSEAFESNQALGRAIAAGLESAGLPAAGVQVIANTERDSIRELLLREDEIDLVIPRGGESLIRFVTEHSRIPVIKHYKGVCHVYVHAAADLDMAEAICHNAKVQRPGVCNAAETILVDRAIAGAFVPRLVATLQQSGVEVRGDEEVRRLGGQGVSAADESDWSAEYLDLVVAMKVVEDLESAVDHIETYGSNHTEAIVTGDPVAAERFVMDIDSSTVVVNASTRFADGGELGLGAEIGVSTTKMHAYGPMGVEGLTSSKFVVRGAGQVRHPS